MASRGEERGEWVRRRAERLDLGRMSAAELSFASRQQLREQTAMVRARGPLGARFLVAVACVCVRVCTSLEGNASPVRAWAA